MSAIVGVIMGSKSDWPTMKSATEMLDEFGISYEVKVVSAHRTPDLMFEYAETAQDRGLEVIIAGAGGSAHLPGMISALTSLPVLGVPIESKKLKGLDSLLSIAQIVKKRASDQKAIVEKLMVEFSITHLKDVMATSLSGGEMRRTEIARCLVSNPKILLLDEPFAGVDLLSIEDIKGLLIKLQARGCAVLVTDHNASQLLSVVDRAYVMANGSIVAHGTPREIVNTSEAKKLYFGENFTY